MTQPAINQTELDGALGVLPPSGTGLLAVIGVSSTGPLNTPATYGRATDLASAFGVGELVEAAALHLERTGLPVLVVRCAATTAATTTVPALTGTGTSVPTADGTNSPLDSYEVYIKVITGGTRATPGITYQYSLDGGRTMSPTIALASAVTIAIPSSGVVIALGVGTLVAGDVITCTTVGPAPSATDLGNAIDALKNSAVLWEICEFASPLSATLFDTVETKFAGLPAAGKYRAWIGNTRIPTDAESESTYLTSLTSAFASKSTVIGSLCAGAAWITSSITGRQYRRPISFAYASRTAAVSEEVNVADPNLGTMIGVAIRDSNGNPVATLHDETVNPGLDDLGFVVLRTFDGLSGVYVNRPRIMSAAGSDFTIMPLRRVMNLARAATRAYLLRRLNQPVLVSPTTGFILEEAALEIEAGLQAALRAVLSGKPKASSVSAVVSRTDNLLSTKTMNVTIRIVPLAYVETINEVIGFTNPALRTVTG